MFAIYDEKCLYEVFYAFIAFEEALTLSNHIIARNHDQRYSTFKMEISHN